MKLLLCFIIGAVFLAMVVALYCALIIVSRFNKNRKNKANGGEKSLKRQICTSCKTGKHAYELDSKSVTCPYIECWQWNKCDFYEPIENETEK